MRSLTPRSAYQPTKLVKNLFSFFSLCVLCVQWFSIWFAFSLLERHFVSCMHKHIAKTSEFHLSRRPVEYRRNNLKGKKRKKIGCCSFQNISTSHKTFLFYRVPEWQTAPSNFFFRLRNAFFSLVSFLENIHTQSNGRRRVPITQQHSMRKK